MEAKSTNPIRAARETAGISRGHLAQLMAVTPAAVSKWEAGIVYPRPRTAERLVVHLPSLTLDAIYAGLHV